jgi:hypothetical protein|nr:MAG TPA: hypothetical protein [Caudoviricetes sp.]DAN16032.1 MAG TPA: hypothetical protein [Bacteriophage sp.]
MNESNFAHAGLALLAQMMTALMATALGADLLSAVVMGGLFAVGFYFGREVAQAERKAGTPPWWSGFDVRKWSLDAKLDLLFPVIVCAGVCVATYWWR